MMIPFDDNVVRKIKKIIWLLKKNAIAAALELYLESDDEEQKNILKLLNNDLSTMFSPAIESPNVFIFLSRTLKEGITYDDFYQAWKPPIARAETVDNKDFYNYFDIPLRAISAYEVSDPKEMIAIATAQCDIYAPAKDFSKAMTRIQKTEQLRLAKIEEVAESNYGENKFCIIMSDDILGP